MTLSRPLRLLPLVLALAACQTAGPRAAGSADAAPVFPASNENLNAVAWVQTSLEYRLIAAQTWRQGLVNLERALRDPHWDALVPAERDTPAAGLPPAVIVDIDETVLDNSPYQARLVRDGGRYDDASWEQWVREQRARPVPGALEFARLAAAQGITIFYVSNRTAAQAAPTLANLRAYGFPVSEAQYLGMGFKLEGCEDIKESDKACRRRFVGRSHRVLMQFGDQLGDMLSLPDNSPEGRERAAAPFAAWFGERWFVLPGPTYGSWETSVLGPERNGSDEARRQRKLDALSY